MLTVMTILDLLYVSMAA